MSLPTSSSSSSSPATPPPTPQDHNQSVADPIAHFRSIPWCAALLASDPPGAPAAVTVTVPDRRPLASGESSFVRKTLNSGSTVRACVTWLRPAASTSPTSPTSPASPASAPASERFLRGEDDGKDEDELLLFPVFSALLDLGADLNSYVGTMHGGLYGVLMDEVMGTAAKLQSPHGAYTVRFQTDYRRQIRPPQVVLVRGRVTRREGRKLFVRGTIEDEDGNIMAEGSGLWLSMGKNVGRSQL
ncbi:HotDog domain-containing protein [Biscogniauxia mediterranea]|nr:HotDog domain-containing protein [Biscogniauxia mediterranea]